MGRRLHILKSDTGLEFPPVESASSEGLLAVGGDLRPERLLAAYRRGIFPWYSEGQPILWWSPDPRAVLFPEKLKVSCSLRKALRQRTFTVTLDTCFRDVMLACAEPRRTGKYKCRERHDCMDAGGTTPGKEEVELRREQQPRATPGDSREGGGRAASGTAAGAVAEEAESGRHEQTSGGTWITPAMVEAYVKLHELGHAHSVEAWQENKLVGGLYGVALGGIFFGESMFARATDASKIVFVHLVRQLERWGYALIDCQQYTAHLARFGAEAIPRREFLHLLAQALALPDRRGRWEFDDLDFSL